MDCEELIALAKEIRAEMELLRQRWACRKMKLPSTKRYQKTDSAVDVMGDTKLKLIAHELAANLFDLTRPLTGIIVRWRELK